MIINYFNMKMMYYDHDGLCVRINSEQIKGGVNQLLTDYETLSTQNLLLECINQILE